MQMKDLLSPSLLKLIRHPEICRGYLHPISSQIDLSNYCNLRCAFCVSKEKKPVQYQHIDTGLLEQILRKLKTSSCKGIEYTGGGEPMVHPNFSNIINLTSDMNFDIGLITNGTLIHKQANTEIWGKFDWIRVSVNAGPSNYKNLHGKNKFSHVMKGLSILDTHASFYGVSYIYTGQDNKDIEELVKELSILKNLGYLRIAKDIYKPLPTQDTIDSLLQTARSCLNPNVTIDFQVSREMWAPTRCIMYKIKPRIDVFGMLYPCCIAAYKNLHCLGEFLNFEQLQDDIDPHRCPYCIYGEINNFCSILEHFNIKNENFI